MKTEDPDYGHIEATYDEGSEDYDDYFKNPHEFIEQDRQQFISRLPPGSKIGSRAFERTGGRYPLLSILAYK